MLCDRSGGNDEAGKYPLSCSHNGYEIFIPVPQFLNAKSAPQKLGVILGQRRVDAHA